MVSLTGRSFVVSLSVVSLAVLSVIPVSAAPDAPDRERHCVVEILGRTDEGRNVLGEESCYGTRVEADLAAGLAGAVGPARAAEGSRDIGAAPQSAGTLWLARHYTGPNYTGSSILVVGSVLCGGGYTPWSGTSWDNNFESSLIYCGGPTVGFYDSSGCGGASLGSSWHVSSLSWMNNRTSCTRYGP